jgi:hypothetical protein
MKFIFGNPPVVQSLPQMNQGWRQFPALEAKRIQNYGLIAACVGMLLVAVLLRGAIRPSRLWIAILILVIALPLHELVHALTTPAWGFTAHTIIGLQGGKGLLLPYMYYDVSQPLVRMLLTGLAPLVLLTALPVILILFAPLSAGPRADLGFLAFFNVATSGGDLVNLYWLVAHLPLHATVQGNGWSLLWKDSSHG